MNLLASCKVAVGALKVNALRTFLAMLGVIIGVASVIVMVSVANGSRQAIDQAIRSLGTNLLVVSPGSFTSGGRHAGGGTAPALSEGDLMTIRTKVPGVVAGAGMIGGVAPLVAGPKNWTTQVKGVSEEYLEARDWPVAEGRNFTEVEMRYSGAKVVILGATVARELFGSTSVVGEQIRIMNVPFKVIGLLSVKGQSAWGTDQDDAALVPITTARRRLFGAEQTIPDNIGTMLLEIASAGEVTDAQKHIEMILRERRRVREDAPDDFKVRDLAEFIRTGTETQSILSVLLGTTAVISLVVGGIGIMNIMLVSVTERTREIGLRMAVGARRRDVLSQFLIEAITLCAIGGLIGLVLGGGAALAMSAWGLWPIALSWVLVLIALLSSGLVGVFFGYYPARRAASMNPIDALHYE